MQRRRGGIPLDGQQPVSAVPKRRLHGAIWLSVEECANDMLMAKCRIGFIQYLQNIGIIRFVIFFCTQGRDRTGTSFTSLVFETSASTYSATWAGFKFLIFFATKIRHFFYIQIFFAKKIKKNYLFLKNNCNGTPEKLNLSRSLFSK